MSRKRNTTGDFLDYFEALSEDASDIVLDEIQRIARKKGITLRYFRTAAAKRRVGKRPVNGVAVEAAPRRVEEGVRHVDA